MRRGTALTAAALLVVGCAGSGERTGMEEDVVASLEVEVRGEGDRVRFVFHVTNAGDEPLELTFPTSQRHDVIVTTPSGEEVWRWSEGMAFLQAISHATLASGESWDMEAVWEPEGRTGELVATAVLTARDRELRQRASFRLP